MAGMDTNPVDSERNEHRIGRRALLGGAASLAAGSLLLRGGARPAPAAAETRAQGLRHLIWVWQFISDAEPQYIGARLRDRGLGLVLKTHDGVEWMSEYDKSPFAVSGPAQTEVLVNYYENAGVPFHAWAVVKGIDPMREAQMAASVLAAGARSLFIDLEPHSGFWQGTRADAVAFGTELRRLQPNAWVVTSIDPRPWVLENVPLAEFARFSNELAPQQYWRTFNTSGNVQRFLTSGIPVGPEGITPEFLLDVSAGLLGSYGLPVTSVGQGATTDPEEWRRFISRAYELGSNLVGVWRYGVMKDDLFSLLQEMPARQPVPPHVKYTVQPGDTLSAIAATYGVSVDSIVALNGISDPNFISVGQELLIPTR